MNEIEIWKPIVYQNIKFGMYEVSNMGRVRNIKTRHIMSQCPSEKGYLMTEFRCYGNKGSRSIKIHRIVAITFVDGRTNERNEVNHIDGNKNNNKASNLEWVSRKENIRHGFDNGLIPALRGSSNGHSRLNEETVHVICEYLVRKHGDCTKVLYDMRLEEYDINLGDIHDIKYKKRWKHISDEYFSREDFNLK